MGAKRILLCDADQLELAALRGTAEERGFEVVDTAVNAVELLRLAELHLPDAALLRNEVPGVSGIEIMPDLRALGRGVEVVLVTSDPTLRSAATAAGAFAVVARGDLAELERALGALSEWLDGGERRSGTDRRRGAERRTAQDWSKVFSERRSGQDRRKGPRRKGDRLRLVRDDDQGSGTD